MSSRITTISLDEQTDKIKDRIPNFSKFVRQCLLRWDALARSPDCPVERLGHPLVGNHCVPAPTRICLKHWPHGSPRREDWKEFRHMLEFDSFHMDRDRLLDAWPHLSQFNCPEEWIQHRAEIANVAQIEFDDMELSGNAKPKKDRRKGKKRRSIRQLLRLLASK